MFIIPFYVIHAKYMSSITAVVSLNRNIDSLWFVKSLGLSSVTDQNIDLIFHRYCWSINIAPIYVISNS